MDMIIAGIVLIFSICGGKMVYTYPAAMHGLYIVGNLVIIAAAVVCIYRRRWPMFGQALGWGFVAVGISLVANLNAIPAGLGRLWLLLIAISIMELSSFLPQEEIKNGLRIACLDLIPIWGMFWLMGWIDNKNILAFYPMIFFAIELSQKGWLLMSGMVTLLLGLDCRGAVLGAISSTSFVLYPYFRRHLKVYATAGAAAFIGLIWLNPNTSAIRFIYFGQAASLFLSSPWFGVGFGALPSYGLLHAHNIFVSMVAEIGLIGCGFMTIAGWRLYQMRHDFFIERWQMAIMVAVLAHSMVDEPLWWPGPLFTFAIILGSIRRTLCQKKLSLS